MFATAFALLLSVSAIAKDSEVALTKDEQALLQELMVKTKVNMLLGSQIEGVATEYKSDGDPLTLEVVMLAKGVGTDRVSEDGEVIFMHEKTKDKAQENLITTAFYIRTKRQVAGLSQSSGK
jgi:hypothetical protein